MMPLQDLPCIENYLMIEIHLFAVKGVHLENVFQDDVTCGAIERTVEDCMDFGTGYSPEFSHLS